MKKLKSTKHLLCFVFGFALLSTMMFACAQQSGQYSISISETSQSISANLEVISSSLPEIPQPEELKIRFSAVGDNLIHSSIYEQAKQRAGGDAYDFNYVYENVKYFFEDYDVNWINQESLVNSELNASTYPCFSTPGELGQAAYDAGWRVFAMSNNHTYDRGNAGIDATRRYWAGMPNDVVTMGLYTSREDDESIVLQEVNGITVAYVAFTEGTNGIPTPQNANAYVIYTAEKEAMQHLVSRAKQLADIVVVGVHWGVEYSHLPSSAQKQLAQDYANWGADVIIGTHPHVIQAIEWLQSEEDGQQVLVAYSLGNFVSAQAKAQTMVGLAITFDINLSVQPDGTRGAAQVQNVHAYPTVTHYDAKFANNRQYMYRDYTQELANTHGCRVEYPQFSLKYIAELTEKYIDDEFLILK